MRKMTKHHYDELEEGLEVRTVGDSRGYLWKIIIDNKRSIGKIEKVSGLRDSHSPNAVNIDGIEYPLSTDASIRDAMQYLTSIIESRYQAA